MHHSSSSSSMAAEQTTRGVAVEKLEYMKKWGFNTYKVNKTAKLPLRSSDVHVVSFFKWSSLCFPLIALVYKTNDLWALRSGFSNRGSGDGGSNWGAERHEKEIWECAATGPSADQPLLQHGADAARSGRHLRWPQSKISRAEGETSENILSNISIDVQCNPDTFFLILLFTGWIWLQCRDPKVAVQERGDSAWSNQLLCVQHQHISEQDDGGHADDHQDVWECKVIISTEVCWIKKICPNLKKMISFRADYFAHKSCDVGSTAPKWWKDEMQQKSR